MLAEARAITARLYESMTTTADQLDDLRSAATREADALRSLLARAGPADGSSGADQLGARSVEGRATSYFGEIDAGAPPSAGPRFAEPDDELAEQDAPSADDYETPAASALDSAAGEPVADVGQPAVEDGTWEDETEYEPELEGSTAEFEEEALEPEPEFDGPAAETAPEAQTTEIEEIQSEPEPPPVDPEPHEPAAQREDGQPGPNSPVGAAEEPADRGEPDQPEAAGRDRATEQLLAEQARERVVANTDEGLAESYALAIESYALAVDRGDSEQAMLWETLRRAILEEARARPEFGQAEPEASLSRRERRRRDKRLRELTKARDAEDDPPPDG